MREALGPQHWLTAERCSNRLAAWRAEYGGSTPRLGEMVATLDVP
jgi:hypothetical protein